MAIEVDYNFAIDKDGQLYRGRLNHDKPDSLELLGQPVRLQGGGDAPAKT
jgi:hypothetical protein